MWRYSASVVRSRDCASANIQIPNERLVNAENLKKMLPHVVCGAPYASRKMPPIMQVNADKSEIFVKFFYLASSMMKKL